MIWRWTGFLIVSGVLAMPAAGVAQPLGTFQWQLQPFCNIVALSVIQQGGLYTLDGFDDQCGAARRAPATGAAVLNPDGTVGLGLTIVTTPGGTPVHLDVAIAVSTLSGTWTDSLGHSGHFAFTPGAGAGGPPRPPSASGLAPGSITAAHLAAGAVGPGQLAPGAVGVAQLAPGIVGALQIDPAQVQTRVSGTCPVGQYLRGIHPNGAVLCEPLLALNVSTTVDKDPTMWPGFYTSIAIPPDGLPIISHHNEAAFTLRITKCGNAACTSGNVSTTVDDPPVNVVGFGTSLAIGADGLPIVSYGDGSAGALRVLHCGNAACTANNVITAVDDPPANLVGLHTSIAIGIDGLPIISHGDTTASGLRVTKCGNVACTTASSTTVDDPPASSAGEFTSIAIGADGLPVISHFDRTAGALRVTKCGNAACTTASSTAVDDHPTNVVGFFTSIAIGADGLPIVSHWDNTAQALRVTKCGNAACTTGNVSTAVDGPFQYSYASSFTSIAIGNDGLPIISYRDTGAAALRVTKCGNAACTAGNLSTTVDDHPVNLLGEHSAIAIGADALPIISHLDSASGTRALRVTKCATQSCR